MIFFKFAAIFYLGYLGFRTIKSAHSLPTDSHVSVPSGVLTYSSFFIKD